MTTGDAGLELDLEPQRKTRDWKSVGFNAGKFLSGLIVAGVATWGVIKPETKANETAENASAAYAVTQKGIEYLSKEMNETKASLSVLTKRYTDHIETYHVLDKRLIRLEERLSIEFDNDDGDEEEQRDIIAELNAIRKQLSDTPKPSPPPSTGKRNPAQIRHEGQQLVLPSAEELFQ